MVSGPSFQHLSGEKLLSAGGADEIRPGGCGVSGISLKATARRSGETGPVQPAVANISIKTTIGRMAPPATSRSSRP
jgi:hypothetical protein